MMGWECGCRRQKCMQNCRGLTSWETSTSVFGKEVRDSMKLDLREMVCEDGKWMVLAQNRAQWLALVLAMLCYHSVSELVGSTVHMG
jgi:hypothetical protein